MKISPHFTSEEMACKDNCGFDTVDPKLVVLLENIRQHFDMPVHIDCACRCEKHNAEVGGERNSQHLLGKAADIKVQGVSPNAVQNYANDIIGSGGGMGRYDTFTHVDVRGTRARWDYRTTK